MSDTEMYKEAIHLLRELVAWQRAADRAERWRNSPPEMQPLYDLLKDVEDFLATADSTINNSGPDKHI